MGMGHWGYARDTTVGWRKNQKPVNGMRHWGYTGGAIKIEVLRKPVLEMRR